MSFLGDGKFDRNLCYLYLLDKLFHSNLLKTKAKITGLFAVYILIKYLSICCSRISHQSVESVILFLNYSSTDEQCNLEKSQNRIYGMIQSGSSIGAVL